MGETGRALRGDRPEGFRGNPPHGLFLRFLLLRRGRNLRGGGRGPGGLFLTALFAGAQDGADDQQDREDDHGPEDQHGPDLDDAEQEFSIVGSTEADPFANKISDDSPLGKALIGSREGDTITVEAPVGILKYTIIEIAK